MDTSPYRALLESAPAPNAGLLPLTDLDYAPVTLTLPDTRIGGSPGSSTAQARVTRGRRSTEQGGPVFVDSSGRRSRRLRRAGWVLGSVCACYAAVVVSSLIGGHAKAPRLLIPGEDDQAPGHTVVISPDKSSKGKPGLLPGSTPRGSGASPAHGKARRGKPSRQPTSGALGANLVSPDRPGRRANASPVGVTPRSALTRLQLPPVEGVG